MPENTTGGISTTASLSEKEKRHLFGVTKTPIRATAVYRKSMEFDHEEIKTHTWLMITPDGKRVVANSYDGHLGRNFDPATATHDLPTDEKRRAKILKSYEQVSGAGVPAFVEMVSPEGGTAPTAEIPSSEPQAEVEAEVEEGLDSEIDLEAQAE